MSETLTYVVSGALGGGLIGALASLVTSRALARKTHAETSAITAKVPAEVDSVVVQGAELAVLTMKSALDSATARIAALEEERDDDRRRIAALEAKVRNLEGKFQRAEKALGEARNDALTLRHELEAYARDHDSRRTR